MQKFERFVWNAFLFSVVQPHDTSINHITIYQSINHILPYINFIKTNPNYTKRCERK